MGSATQDTSDTYVDEVRCCSAGFLCAAAEFGQVNRVWVSEANVDVDHAAPARGLRNADIEPGLGDRGSLPGPGIRPRRQLIVPSRHVSLLGDGHARVPAFQRPLEPVPSPIVEGKDSSTDLAAPTMITSQIQRRPAEFTCSRPVLRAENVFAVRGWRKLRVTLLARVIAAKASAQRSSKVDVAQSRSFLTGQRREQV